MKIPEKVKARIKTCKALQGKTIFDILKTDEYQTNLSAYISCQKEDRQKTFESYRAMKVLNKTAKVPAHVIDHFEKWEAKDFTLEYMRILQSRSGLSKDERHYIMQICLQAYNKTVADFVVAEFPRYAKYFFSKPN